MTEPPDPVQSEAVILTPSSPAQVGDINIAPTTTAAQDTTATGQRRVNLIWETVQASIAVSVTGVTLWVSANISSLLVTPGAMESQAAAGSLAFMLLSNLTSLIIGFYFGRTNHQKTGGIGEPQADFR